MRIVHVVDTLDMGGQERLVLDLSRELRARGHEPMVIALSPGGDLRPEFGDTPISDVPRRRGGFDPSAVARLARRLAALRPDVVHTHNDAPLCYAVPAARAVRVRAVVHTKHGAGPYADYSRGTLLLARLASRLVSAFVVVSDETRTQALGAERPSERRLRVVRNGIPLERFRPDPSLRARVRSELGVPEDAVVIGSVGRLVPEKNFPLLVRAALPLVGDGVHLLIVGEGAERPAIEACIPEAARAQVRLLGLRRDVPAVLAAFDVFALSSRTEGLPLVLPEAMSTGLPIVATRVGGVPAVIRPSFGRLVPSDDERALGAALAELVGDEELRRALGAAAIREAHEGYAIEAMTDRYLELYTNRAP